jgi:hypothetical protein
MSRPWGLPESWRRAKRFRAPEEKHVIMAGVGGGIRILETTWRDFRRSRERAEREAERQQEARMLAQRMERA